MQAHLFRVKVSLDSRVKVETLHMSAVAAVDDRINSVQVVQQDAGADVLGIDMGKNYLSGFTGFTVGSGAPLDPTVGADAITLPQGNAWQAGVDNYLIWKTSNIQSKHGRPGVVDGVDYGGDSEGMPLGMYAKVTLAADCVSQQPAFVPVPVNSPWMLGALGAGLALLGARSRRKNGK